MPHLVHVQQLVVHRRVEQLESAQPQEEPSPGLRPGRGMRRRRSAAATKPTTSAMTSVVCSTPSDTSPTAVVDRSWQ